MMAKAELQAAIREAEQKREAAADAICDLMDISLRRGGSFDRDNPTYLELSHKEDLADEELKWLYAEVHEATCAEFAEREKLKEVRTPAGDVFRYTKSAGWQVSYSGDPFQPARLQRMGSWALIPGVGWTPTPG